MSEASDNFELLICRIHELIDGDDVEVEWNEKIEDPDNPDQDRQIDVTIRRGDLLNIVECRLRKRRQDVNWIEELIGRRTSLNANAVVAVSSSGFTKGAKNKAGRFGIILRELSELSEAEISSWTRSIRLSILYYEYESFKLSLLFGQFDVRELNVDDLKNELRSYIGFNALFKQQLEAIDDKHLLLEENRDKTVSFKVNFGIDNFYLCGKQVQQIQSEGKAKLEELKLDIPEVLAYSSPADDSQPRNVYVQRFNLGESRIIHHNGKISITIDLSKLEFLPYQQFRFVKIAGEHENYLETLELVSPEKINMKIDKINLAICANGA